MYKHIIEDTVGVECQRKFSERGDFRAGFWGEIDE